MEFFKLFLILFFGGACSLSSMSSFAEETPEKSKNLMVLAEKLHASHTHDKTHKMNLKMIKKYEQILKVATLPENKKTTLMFRLAEKYTEEEKYYLLLKKEKDSKEYRKKSIKVYKDILQNSPQFRRNDEVLYFLGRALLKTEDRSKAAQYFQRLIKEYSNSKYSQEAKTQLQKL